MAKDSDKREQIPQIHEDVEKEGAGSPESQTASAATSIDPQTRASLRSGSAPQGEGGADVGGARNLSSAQESKRNPSSSPDARRRAWYPPIWVLLLIAAVIIALFLEFR